VVGDGEAVVIGPGANCTAPLPARCRPGACALPVRAYDPCVLNERRKLSAEVGSMSCAQVDFVARAVDGKGYGLVGGSPGQVVLEPYIDSLHYFPPNCAPAPHLTARKSLMTHSYSHDGSRCTGVEPCIFDRWRGPRSDSFKPGTRRHWSRLTSVCSFDS
jgi:hypothetical protein